MNPSTRQRWISRGAVALVAVIAAIVPLVIGDLTFFVQMVLSAIVVTGLSLFMGYAGQASLGQGAFVAVGALTVAVLTVRLGVEPLLALLLAPVLAAVFAIIVGAPLLRLRGHYLAFGTLALLLLVQVIMSTVPFFGGGLGIFGIPPLSIAGVPVRGQLVYAYPALGVLALVLVITHNLVGSRFGRGMRSLSGSETAAASSGVPVLRTKVTVFAVAAGFAGLAGGISAFFTPYVSQDSFPALTSFEYVIMAVIGGLGTLWGGVVGAVVISLLLQALNALSALPGLPPTAAPILQYAGYAIVLIVTLLLIPKGIVPFVDRLRQRWSRVERAAVG